MLYPEENDNGGAPMSQFTIKNEPDEVEQFGVKQEPGGLINSINHVPVVENSVIIHSSNFKDENIAKTENTCGERYEKIEDKQMESSIHPTITSMDLQPSLTQTNIKMHPTMKDEIELSHCYGKNDMNNQTNADQCVLKPDTTNWDIKDVECNASVIWDAGESVKVEEEYLIQETIKPEQDECEMNTKGASNITQHEVLQVCTCEGVGCNKYSKEQVSLNPQLYKETFECGVCGKSFAWKSQFKKHRQLHAEQKPLKCAVCEKSFAQRLHLKVHQQIHNGEKTFKCEVCEKSFVVRSQLKVHQRIHTGENLFEYAL